MITDHWQHDALERELQALDGMFNKAARTIRLTDPERERRLDDILLGCVLPAASAALHDFRPLRPLHFSKFGASSHGERITTLFHKFVTRELALVIQDPARPFGTGQPTPPWYSRMNFQVSTQGFHVVITTSVEFPENFSWPKLKKLLADPLLASCPPSLSAEPAADGREGGLNAAFETGSGETCDPVDAATQEHEGKRLSAETIAACEAVDYWNLAHAEAELGRLAYRTATAQLLIIERTEKLAQNWKDTGAFNRLREALVDCHHAN